MTTGLDAYGLPSIIARSHTNRNGGYKANPAVLIIYTANSAIGTINQGRLK